MSQSPVAFTANRWARIPQPADQLHPVLPGQGREHRFVHPGAEQLHLAVRRQPAHEAEVVPSPALQPLEQRPGEVQHHREEPALVHLLEEGAVHLLEVLFEDRVEVAHRLMQVDAKDEPDRIGHGRKGISQIVDHTEILHALNPMYAIRLLIEYPGGFWLLGAVFLCTTGADALYSDLGHCGKNNIRVSWIFVKICLLLNYFGQAAWLIQHQGLKREDLPISNPFYGIMPEWFLIFGIGIATVATVIASQAMITGAFTLINEAMRLNLWPKVRVVHPTDLRGQLYVPSINWILYAGCIGVVLFFGESKYMEAAYGLAINLTMIVTTILISTYSYVRRGSYTITLTIGITFLCIEICFLVANLIKYPHGGYVATISALSFIIVMYSWYKARKIKNRFLEFDSR